MEKTKKASFDFLSGLLSIIFGIIYALLAYNLKRSPMGDPMAPSIFPLIIAAGLVIFGAVLVFRSNAQELKNAFEKIKTSATEHSLLSRKMIVLTVISSLVYALIFEHFGYVISTFLFIAFIMTVLEKNKIVRNLIVSLIFSIAVYYVFFYLLGISLPMTPFLNI